VIAPLFPTEATGLGAEEVGRLESFADQFRPVFPRADQFRRFVAYLAGLLAPGSRKNVEAIATRAAGLAPAEADLVQALQHFITRSPWDAGRLFAASRSALAGPLADPGSVWVVHDAVFPKKGRHSAGVHRQFARSLGQKVNCQIAVVLSQAGPGGYFPLAARLYLPAYWLRESPELAARTVPEEHRRPTSKAEIALALVDEVRAEGWAPGLGTVEAEEGYAAAHEWIDGLAARGLAAGTGAAGRTPDAVAAARRGFDDLRGSLGLDHFEGRTWVGWHHHVSLVFAAYAFRTTDPAGEAAEPPPSRRGRSSG